MAKELIHSFAIKLVSQNKSKRVSNNFTKIGKKCHAVVIEDDGILKARLTTTPIEDSENIPDEFLIIPFTDESFSLKGKLYVFLKEKDKYNHYVCIIRDYMTANLHPGLDIQYDTLHKGLLISGYVIKKDDKHYFDYRDIIAYSEGDSYINEINVSNVNK